MRHATIAVTGILLVAGALFVAWHHVDQRQGTSRRIDFSRDIRPILNQNCTSCHGGVRQKNGVSFIYREEALGKGKSGRPTIVPGDPEASELIARLISTDPEMRMPYRAPPLAPEQISLLRQWIEEGAHWEDHWSFVPPRAQHVPRVKTPSGVRQPIDNFIVARLEEEQLTHSPEADRSALLRRVSFDLTGLPPSPQALEAFLVDTAEDAYEKQVDQLLASPHYGERWATMWQDLARYADSKGYDQDNPREVWPYRDWVVEAFNRNVPYDRFVITQLAGDLLPQASFEDRIATAFHRLAPANDEVGTDDEEFRLTAVLDRVATTWSVLNGLTMNCVQCHSHPYDPIRQEEYYRFLAFFNTSQDSDASLDDAPVLHVPESKADYPRAFELQQQIGALSEEIVDAGRRIARDAAQWKLLPITEATTNKTLGFERQLAFFKRQGPLVYSELFSFSKINESDRRGPLDLYDGYISQVKAQIARARGGGGDEIAAYELRNGEAWARAGNIVPAAVSELFGRDLPSTLTALRIEVPPVDPTTSAHTPAEGFVIERIDAWIIRPDGSREKIVFGSFAPDLNEHLTSQLALIGVEARSPAPPGPPTLSEQVKSGALQAIKLFDTRWIVGIPASPIELQPGSRIRVELTHTNSLATNAAHAVKPTVVHRVRLLASSNPQWSALATDAKRASQIDRLQELYRQLAKIPAVPLPVMAEQSPHKRRQTLLFRRGNFLDKTGSPLTADVPAVFPKLPKEAPRDRLAMARWFFSPEQPLTARVAVNRFWEQLFGTGLVETLEDFGSVGAKPSHPELLDWLALHFQNDLKWDMKALLREIVLSATYRQSAKVTPALLEKDPHNRLLARGPRQRLTAEMVRDQALAASGLLTPAMGGPSVMPPLPTGVEPKMGYSLRWLEAKGADRYRRALYIHFQRSSPFPSLITFDAATRDVSYARRLPTNTPLQALATLNDVVQMEAATALAQRIFKETPDPWLAHQDIVAAQLTYGAHLVLSRELTSVEMTGLRTLYEKALERAQASNESRKSAVTARQLTALSAVSSVLLNFDAALTR